MEAEPCMSRSAGHCTVMGTASHDGVDGRGARADAARQRRDPRGRFAALRRRRIWPDAASCRWSQRGPAAVRRSSRARRSRTPSASTAPSAARPTPSSICSRSRAGSACRSRSPTGTSFGRDVPTIVDIKPSGRFLMEDFYYAGGVPAVMRELGEPDLLHRDALTVNGQDDRGRTVATRRAGTREVIRPLDRAARRARRHCRPARQPRARRRGDQAVRGVARV